MKKETGMPPIDEASDQEKSRPASVEEEIKAKLKNTKFGPFKFPNSTSKHELIKIDGELFRVRYIAEDHFRAFSLADNNIVVDLTPQEYAFKEIGSTLDVLNDFGLGITEKEREIMKKNYGDEKEAGYSIIFGEYQKR